VSTGGRLFLDVGSSRIKGGWYAPPPACDGGGENSLFPLTTAQLAEPDALAAFVHRGRPGDAWRGDLRQWLGNLPPALTTWLATVHPRVADEVDALLQESGRAASRRLTYRDLPLEIRVERPERVGVDRLLAAVAVNRVRAPHTPAITVDAGTAITVDLVESDGAFAGGAIAPGLALAASSLHGGAPQLPELQVTVAPPWRLGKSTEEALAAGIFWGTAGGIAELVRRVEPTSAEPAELYVTGGDAAVLRGALAEMLGRPLRHVPHLVLAGAALAADDPR